MLFDWAVAASSWLYAAINGLSGRSLLFDRFMELALENNLVKAGVLGACFVFAWHRDSGEPESVRRRQILLVSLAAALLALATTKTMSSSVFLPRPAILSQKTFHLEGDRLVEARQLPYRVPIGQEETAAARARGEISPSDFESFPSDHASFYMTLAVGIFMASRGAGVLAILWVLCVTLGSRVVTGRHSPLDIAVGSAIGIAILCLLRIIVARFAQRLAVPAVKMTDRYAAVAAALLFLVMYETTNTLEDVKELKAAADEVRAGGEA